MWILYQELVQYNKKNFFFLVYIKMSKIADLSYYQKTKT